MQHGIVTFKSSVFPLIQHPQESNIRKSAFIFWIPAAYVRVVARKPYLFQIARRTLRPPCDPLKRAAALVNRNRVICEPYVWTERCIIEFHARFGQVGPAVPSRKRGEPEPRHEIRRPGHDGGGHKQD